MIKVKVNLANFLTFIKLQPLQSGKYALGIIVGGVFTSPTVFILV